MTDTSQSGAQNRATEDFNSGKTKADTTKLPVDTANAYNNRFDFLKKESEKKSW